MSQPVVKKPLLGTNDINQVCFVVKDIENAAVSWAKLLGDVVPEPFCNCTTGIFTSEILW